MEYLITKKTPAIIAPCGAKAEIQGNMARAQTEVPVKGGLCGECVYRKQVTSGVFELVSTDPYRNCLEERVPVAHHRQNLPFIYSFEGKWMANYANRLANNFVHLPLLHNQPVPGMIFGTLGIIEAAVFARSRAK